VLRRHPYLVARAHAAGIQVHVWTVNEPEDVEFVLGLGVNAVITDRPRTLLDRLGRPAAS
jgi:glycerophosphoryl diester phosphodiesterase